MGVTQSQPCKFVSALDHIVHSTPFPCLNLQAIVFLLNRVASLEILQGMVNLLEIWISER